MTPVERDLIKQLESVTMLAWQPGMWAEWEDENNRFVYLVVRVNGPYLELCNGEFRHTSDCTHAPCAALTGWLVEQLQNKPNEILEINHSEGYSQITIYSSYDLTERISRLPRRYLGQTLTEGLLKAYLKEVKNGATPTF